ncbi:MAG: nitric oxide reductase activation protein NorD [Gemmatimonadaceae bacterium]
MNRTRAVLMKKTRAATQPALRLWQRWRSGQQHSGVPLDSVRRRLELFLSAVYGRDFQIVHVDEPASRSWMRPINRTPRWLRGDRALPANDGHCILLPSELPSELNESAHNGVASARFRVLAIEQAERIARGTAAYLPSEGELLERDLYLLREGAAVDAAISRSIGGMHAAIAKARVEALAHRPSLEKLRPCERGVELLVRRVLSVDPTDAVPDPDAGSTPAESLKWARDTAAALRANSPDTYRGVAPVAFWGTVSDSTSHHADIALQSAPAESEGEEPSNASDQIDPRSKLRKQERREYRYRSPIVSPDASSFMVQVESANGAERELTPKDGGSGEEYDDSHGEEGSALWTPAPDTAGASDAHREVDRTRISPLSRGSVAKSGDLAAAALASAPIEYPEWDCYAGQYRPRGVTVRVNRQSTEIDSTWAHDVLRQRAILVRRVRDRFERLRSQRARLTRQRDGDELDLAACVRALVDRRMGQTPDDRLYESVRPARRALAIALLVDVSGSTDAQVTDALQVIDIEKIALLLASEAFDALGDRYSILTFSSHGAADVRLALIKDFTERNSDSVRRSISAIAPGGNTRLGAAVRHTTSLLSAQPAGHRLLLILSDGKPSDTDRYFEKYAVEDTRQAVLEARTQGIYPFCLTVDAHDPGEYLSHIFGPTGHTILRHPEQLPLALLKVVRQLLGAGQL